MKELSIEEKAKAYDEAIKRVEDIKTGKCKTTFMFTEGLFEHIFPELKESEDEMAIEWCVSHFRECSRVSCNNAEYQEFLNNKIIPWLEKQGKKDEEILILKDQIESLHAAIKAIKETHRIELEKQDEQKPAWSEEDRKTIDNLISQLGNLFARKLIKEETKDKYVNWLKSLKERYTWKPSDEQMEAIKEAIDFLGCTKKVREDLKSLYEQLKKLMEE